MLLQKIVLGIQNKQEKQHVLDKIEKTVYNITSVLPPCRRLLLIFLRDAHGSDAASDKSNKNTTQQSRKQPLRGFSERRAFCNSAAFLSCHCGIPVPVLFLCALDAYLFTVLPYMPCINGVMRQVGCNRFLFSAFGKERTISL